MTLVEKINSIEKLVVVSLEQLNILYAKAADSEKEDYREAIAVHIGYAVFLKELHVKNEQKQLKNIGKEFLISQFSNIQKSCHVVEEIYNEKT